MTGSNAEQTISQEKYVSVATFRKTGVAAATATWIVPVDGGRVGLLTSSASGKAKRLRNNSRRTTLTKQSRWPRECRPPASVARSSVER